MPKRPNQTGDFSPDRAPSGSPVQFTRRGPAIVLPSGALALIDAEDIDRIVGLRWSEDSAGYVYARVPDNAHLLLHRFLLDAPPTRFVEHLNGDRLDNRRENLRLVRSVRSTRVSARSGVRNVHLDTTSGRFTVRMVVDGVRYVRGPFDSVEDAADAAAVLRQIARVPIEESHPADLMLPESDWTDEDVAEDGEITHHLFRLRVSRSVWDRLTSVALHESARSRRKVSASDLARTAISDWLAGYEESSRLGALISR